MFDNTFLNNIKKNFFFYNVPFFKNFFLKGTLSLKNGNFCDFFIFYFLFNFLFGIFPFSYKIGLRAFDFNNLDSGSFKTNFFFNIFNCDVIFLFLKYNFVFIFLSNFKKENIFKDFPIIYNINFSGKFFYTNIFNIYDIFYLPNFDDIDIFSLQKNIIFNYCLSLNKSNSINIIETP